MDALHVAIEGIGWWSPGVDGWPAACAQLRDGALVLVDGPPRPAAGVLSPNERRRAPGPVLLACEVAQQACRMAGRDAATLACVFASAHGDVAITDAMCRTLADEPLTLSPTRFHNSVHNAPAGYWTVATACHAPSSALSAWHDSLAAGLFAAAVQAHADEVPVLFAMYDIAACGALQGVVDAPFPYALAFVLSPAPHHGGAAARVALRHEDAVAEASPPPESAARLLGWIAKGPAGTLRLPNGAATLAIEALA